MKYLPIDSKLFKKNRSKFVSQMLPNSIAIFNSNDIFSTGADSTLPFYQHRNIFYLSGVDQEESILILNPNARKEMGNNARKKIEEKFTLSKFDKNSNSLFVSKYFNSTF